jgi:hypothetical protein
MTAPALVKSSDLKRMADIAKAKGVTIEMEIGGRIIRISPSVPELKNDNAIAPRGGIRL